MTSGFVNARLVKPIWRKWHKFKTFHINQFSHDPSHLWSLANVMLKSWFFTVLLFYYFFYLILKTYPNVLKLKTIYNYKQKIFVLLHQKIVMELQVNEDGFCRKPWWPYHHICITNSRSQAFCRLHTLKKLYKATRKDMRWSSLYH